jgi:hypothetical protein
LNLDSCERFIAPADFVTQMARSANISFSDPICKETLNSGEVAIISTIPMPVMMKLVDWEPIPAFNFKPIWVLSFSIEDPSIDIYQTLYFPDLNFSIYRASITGNRVIAEFVEEVWDPGLLVHKLIEHFGLPEDSKISEESVTFQPMGKISPIDDKARKEFIYKASKDFQIYSLGRFATWRQILLDDLVKDVNFIDNFISQPDIYEARKASL